MTSQFEAGETANHKSEINQILKEEIIKRNILDTNNFKLEMDYQNYFIRQNQNKFILLAVLKEYLQIFKLQKKVFTDRMLLSL